MISTGCQSRGQGYIGFTAAQTAWWPPSGAPYRSGNALLSGRPDAISRATSHAQMATTISDMAAGFVLGPAIDSTEQSGPGGGHIDGARTRQWTGGRRPARTSATVISAPCTKP